MNKGRTIITVIVAVLVVAATGHADMRPVCPPDASVQTARSCDQLNPLRYGPLSPFGPFGIPYTGPRSAGYPAEAQPDIGQTHRAQPLRILANEQDTLSFCLYSLLGLGLLKSAPYVKRLS